MRVNPDNERRRPEHRGWKGICHDLSHLRHSRENPDMQPHCGAHARLEIRLIKEVIKRGWLTGTIEDKPRVAKPAVDARNSRYERICQRIEGWERRERRAINALKKLRKQRAYYERSLAKTVSATVH